MDYPKGFHFDWFRDFHWGCLTNCSTDYDLDCWKDYYLVCLMGCLKDFH